MSTDKNEGEGNKTADRRYRQKTRNFVEPGKVDDAAEEAANLSREELGESKRAEAEAREKKKS